MAALVTGGFAVVVMPLASLWRPIGADAAPRGTGMPLPTPDGDVRVRDLRFTHKGAPAPVLQGVSFKLKAGESLAIIGPTAAGKTTLARLLVGNFRPDAGDVRLDGADVASWDPEDLGRHIGYLPQDIELFNATVRENIARMGEGDPEAVVAAAQLAGVHEMILQLPQGYDTEIGEAGAALSGGQRQRIALARALYGDPKFLVLDEPNANLDNSGEAALLAALEALRQRGATIVIIAHRPSIVRTVDRILVLRAGTVEMLGPRDEVLSRVTGPEPDKAVTRAGEGHG